MTEATSKSTTTLNQRLSRAVPKDLLEDETFRATLREKASTVDISSSASDNGGVSDETMRRLTEAATSPKRVVPEGDSDLVPHLEHRATNIARRRGGGAAATIVKKKSTSIDRNSPLATASDPSSTTLLPSVVTWQVAVAGSLGLLLLIIIVRRWQMVKALGLTHALAAELPALTSVFALLGGTSVEHMRLVIRQFDSGIHPSALRYTPLQLLPPQLTQQEQAPQQAAPPPPQQPSPSQSEQQQAPPPEQKKEETVVEAERVDPRKETILLLIEEATAYAEEARDAAEQEAEQQVAQAAEQEKENQQEQEQQQQQEYEDDDYDDEEEETKRRPPKKRAAAPQRDVPLQRRSAETIRGVGAAAAAVKRVMSTPQPVAVKKPPVDTSVEVKSASAVAVDRSVEQQPRDLSVESAAVSSSSSSSSSSSASSSTSQSHVPMISSSKGSIPGVKRMPSKGADVGGSTITL